MNTLLGWLESGSLAPHTRRAYRNEVERLTTYLGERDIVLSELQVTHLERFWKHLKEGRLHRDGRRPSAGSMQQSRRILSAYLRWCVSRELVAPNILAALDRWAVPVVPQESPRPAPGNPAVPVALLLEAKDLDAAAAALSFWTGASPKELAGLRLAAFDWEASEATIQRGSNAATVVLPRVLSDSLRRLSTRAKTYMFGSESPSTAVEMARRIARWGKQHGVDAVSARSLRVRFLELAETAGWSPDEIRNQLRRCELRLPLPPPPPLGRLAVLEKAVHACGRSR